MTEAVSEAMKHTDDYVRNGRGSRPAVLTVFLLSLGFAACGSDDSPAPPGAASPTAADAEDAAADRNLVGWR